MFYRRLVPWIIAAVAILAPSAVFGQNEDDPDIKSIAETIDTFFANLNNKNVTTSSAYQTLLQSNDRLRDNEKVGELSDKTDALKSMFGAFQQSESLPIKKIGTDIVVFRYLYKCEHQPVVWYFTYYRPAGTWKIISVRFDTNLEALIK